MARQIQKGCPIGSDPAWLSSGVNHVIGAFTKIKIWTKSCPKKTRGIRLRTSPWETKPWGRYLTISNYLNFSTTLEILGHPKGFRRKFQLYASPDLIPGDGGVERMLVLASR